MNAPYKDSSPAAQNDGDRQYKNLVILSGAVAESKDLMIVFYYYGRSRTSAPTKERLFCRDRPPDCPFKDS